MPSAGVDSQIKTNLRMNKKWIITSGRKIKIIATTL